MKEQLLVYRPGTALPFLLSIFENYSAYYPGNYGCCADTGTNINYSHNA